MQFRDDRGFSLLELMIALFVVLIMGSGAFLALNQNQKVYVSRSNNSTMYTAVRSAAELITQEIGQAGSVCGSDSTCFSTKLTSAVSSGTSLNVANTAGLFQGEKLTLDPNNVNDEVVQISSINSSTSITLLAATPVTNSHVAGAYVVVQGVFWQGVMSTGQPSAGQGSTATKLKMYGDINGDGNLVYVEYNCSFSGGNNGTGSLTRSVTPIAVSTAANPNPPTTTITLPTTPDVLIDNLVWNAPNGYTGNPYCFIYNTVSYPASDGNTYYTTTQIQLLISVKSPNPDPQTHQYAQLTKSFLQLSPRNVVAAHDMLSNDVTATLQPTPPSVPLN
jgi:prepilin-type N-terminal cleavage/methylation domain-containing protein